MAALLPDSVTPEQLATALGVKAIRSRTRSGETPMGMDPEPQPISIGRLDCSGSPRAGARHRQIDRRVRLRTGLHPTTALCLEGLQEIVRIAPPDAVLDVGTGSGVLALAALTLGVPRALAIDLDGDALRVAASDARLNGLAERVQIARGGPESIRDMATRARQRPRRSAGRDGAGSRSAIGHRGQVLLSGIPSSVEPDVDQAYRRLGMHRVNSVSRAGWFALVLRASW